VIPGDAQLEDTEGDGARGHRRQVGEPPQEQRHQRPQQHAEPQLRPRREAEDAPPQEDGDEGQGGGPGPHHGLEAVDGDAEQRCPVGAVGAGPDGNPGVTGPQQPRDQHHDHGGDEQGQEVVGIEHHPPHLGGGVEGRGDAVGDQPAVPQLGEEEGHGHEGLAQPDGGDGDEQPGGAEEPADDDPLGGAAEDDRRDQPRDGGHAPRHADLVEQQVGQHRRCEPEVGLREVDDPVRSVDQRHAEGQQGGEAADDHPTHHDPGRRREQDLLGQQQEGSRAHGGCRPPEPATRDRGRRLVGLGRLRRPW
jgi:hypothetical protein